MKFHSPYNFIPVTGKINGESSCKTSFKSIAAGETPYARHDRWEKDACSGRIVCTLTTNSPLVIGGEQINKVSENGIEGYVHPYLNRGYIAIPGNSLRGMIGSIVETLSQSSLRILDQSKTSYTCWLSKDNKKYIKGDINEAFSNTTGRHVLPWGLDLRNSSSDKITAAEALFGVVESNVQEQSSARNIKSRIKIFDALSTSKMKEEHLGKEITLKILSEPNLPSPAMYFYSTNNCSIKKKELNLQSNPNFAHLPNGRKRYIPHPRSDWDNSSGEKPVWETRIENNNHLKRTVRPIPKEKEFQFHIDFENISPAELSLLLASIEPQNVSDKDNNIDFQHRLGMGKPLGLGHVSVKIKGVFLIDRCERYRSTALFGNHRYSRWWNLSGCPWPQNVLKRYAHETQAATHEMNKLEWNGDLIDQNTLNILLKMGDPESVKHIVRYPFSTSKNQTQYSEEQGFKWYIEYENSPMPIGLKPVSVDDTLPFLESDLRHADKNTTNSQKNNKQLYNTKKPNNNTFIYFGTLNSKPFDLLESELSCVFSKIIEKECKVINLIIKENNKTGNLNTFGEAYINRDHLGELLNKMKNEIKHKVQILEHDIDIKLLKK